MAGTLARGTPEEAGMASDRIGRVKERAAEWVRDGVASSLVLLGARRGRIVLYEAWGSLNDEANSPPLPLDALFHTASVGKVFTAAALMLLVEEGRVGLNRPVVSYLPEFQGEGKEAVLVRHLLTHTAGVRDKNLDQYAKEHKGSVAIPPAPEGLHPMVHEYLQARYSAPLWKPPGQEMSYSPYGCELIGEIIRRVSGEPLDRFAERRIFRPLGMRDTSYCMVDLPKDRMARPPGYLLGETEEERWAREHERVCWASGSTLTSAMDLAVFGQMFLNRGAYGDVRILSPATVDAMTRNQIPGIGAQFEDEYFPEANWGLGWSIHGRKAGMCGGLYSERAYEHWGAGGIYFWVDPEYEIVGVYLSSCDWLDANHKETMVRSFRCDLFTDALTAAVVEL